MIKKNIKVLNDSAERAVKLTVNFKDKAWSEDHFSKMFSRLLIRKETTPDIRKRRKITNHIDE